MQPIYEDPHGRIWIGGYGGLAQVVDDRLVFLTEKTAFRATASARFMKARTACCGGDL